MTVTALGIEKKQRVPLWVQHDATYALTQAGHQAAQASGIDVSEAADADSTMEVQAALVDSTMAGEMEVEVEVEVEAAQVDSTVVDEVEVEVEVEEVNGARR
jgi:hypothetical protein